MLMIRLQRTGRKHEPTFRLVLTDSRNSTKSGRYLEVLGNHDPRKDNATELKADRIKHWIGNGAQLSGTVHNMLIEKKIITGKKINVLPRKSPPKKEGEETPIVAEVKAEATPAPEAAPEAPTDVPVEATPQA
jgi:small subunit ribosomal protein S16